MGALCVLSVCGWISSHASDFHCHCRSLSDCQSVSMSLPVFNQRHLCHSLPTSVCMSSCVFRGLCLSLSPSLSFPTILCVYVCVCFSLSQKTLEYFQLMSSLFGIISVIVLPNFIVVSVRELLTSNAYTYIIFYCTQNFAVIGI